MPDTQLPVNDPSLFDRLPDDIRIAWMALLMPPGFPFITTVRDFSNTVYCKSCHELNYILTKGMLLTD